ncbi:transporter [Alloacidobacterium dinghuense]|uniref:Transporter n=1 Tax=Alloacidobacterium dinghuense TaxID=2763107 RepID=A0A7G8BP04_9BACT|nr:transporter [Alloacidobacterium dinghuense]QNI34274.1 transporter [Alloacidobacterium dinghuense]
MRRELGWRAAILAVVAFFSLRVEAQQLEPRAYSASPVGTSFLSVGFSRSTGDVTFDPTIPVTNVNATLHFSTVGLSHTFGVFGRQTLFSAAIPYVWGNITGQVGEVSGKIYRSGLSDMVLRYSVNLHGSPAMSPKEFASYRQSYILATSITVQAPSGQYGSRKLINIGANRWAFKPEVGFSYPVRKLYLDLYAGAWLYTANSSFYPGTANRTQQPTTALQAHVSYNFRRALWAAFDATWYGGGAISTNGGPDNERQSNSRIGGTVSIPLRGQQSIKVAYSSGVTGTIGANLKTVTISWQKIWLH